MFKVKGGVRGGGGGEDLLGGQSLSCVGPGSSPKPVHMRSGVCAGRLWHSARRLPADFQPASWVKAQLGYKGGWGKGQLAGRDGAQGAGRRALVEAGM